MFSRRQAVIVAVCGALAVFLMGSLLPIWDTYHFCRYGVVVYPGTLWQAVGKSYETLSNPDTSISTLATWNEFNFVQGIVLLAIGAAAGLVVFWVLAKCRTANSIDQSSSSALGQLPAFPR